MDYISMCKVKFEDQERNPPIVYTFNSDGQPHRMTHYCTFFLERLPPYEPSPAVYSGCVESRSKKAAKHLAAKTLWFCVFDSDQMARDSQSGMCYLCPDQIDSDLSMDQFLKMKRDEKLCDEADGVNVAGNSLNVSCSCLSRQSSEDDEAALEGPFYQLFVKHCVANGIEYELFRKKNTVVLKSGEHSVTGKGKNHYLAQERACEKMLLIFEMQTEEKQLENQGDLDHVVIEIPDEQPYVWDYHVDYYKILSSKHFVDISYADDYAFVSTPEFMRTFVHPIESYAVQLCCREILILYSDLELSKLCSVFFVEHAQAL